MSKMQRVAASWLVLAAALVGSGAAAAGFELLYAYDDADIQTAARQRELGAANQLQRALAQEPAPAAAKTLVESRFPRPPEPVAAKPTPAGPLLLSFARLADEASGAKTSRRDEEPLARRAEEPPRHWSGLENYYELLRQSALRASSKQRDSDLLVYQQAEEDDGGDDNKYNNYEQLPGDRLSLGDRQQVQPTQQQQQPFLLPLDSLSAADLARLGLVTQQRVELGDEPPEPPSRQPRPLEVLSYGLPAGAWTSGGGGDLQRLHEQYMRALELRALQQERLLGAFEPRLRQLQADELPCGPRNLLRLGGRRSPPSSADFGEFPSHAGLYSGPPGEDNFLCGATLVHERFLLTPASCLQNQQLQGSRRLKARLGEWNLGRNSSGGGERPLLVLDVDEVFVFPAYANGSRDHNLALVRLAKRVDYSRLAYLSPACQPSSRAKLEAASCRAPVRRLKTSEFFDPSGEGETRLRRQVQMEERPVELVANDELDCFNRTKQQLFNFLHPNLICAADFRRSLWRQQLNQTDSLGSGVYCDEGGLLSLVSLVQPVELNSSSSYGLLDLTFYKPWMRNVTSGRSL